jgi:NADPH2:quinone reductase
VCSYNKGTSFDKSSETLKWPLKKTGEWVLVNAAAGGVGLAAVQIAKGLLSLCYRLDPPTKGKEEKKKLTQFLTALGAKVIAATGSQQKMEIAKRLGGADFVINYSKPGWQKEVLALTNERGVDVIYDPVGLINGRHFSNDRTEIAPI